MQTNLVMMPIKVLYLNQIKLGEVLKVTKLLLRLVNNLGLKFDSESYIKEMKEVEVLLKFSNSEKFFRYITKKYIPDIKIYEFVDGEQNIIFLKNEMFIGSHEINIETFNFLNEILWPDLLTLYINRVLNKSSEENMEIDLSFEMNELQCLYSLYNIEYVVKEFISDLSLYLTYNQLGYLNLSEDNIIISKENLRLKMQIVI